MGQSLRTHIRRDRIGKRVNVRRHLNLANVLKSYILTYSRICLLEVVLGYLVIS